MLERSIYKSTQGHHPTAKAGVGTVECDETGCVDFPDPAYTPQGPQPSYGPIVESPTYGTGVKSSGSGINATTLSAITSISNAFSKIFTTIQPVPAGCTQVTTAQGSSVQCLSSIQQQQGVAFGSSSILGGLNSSTVMLLIAGVAALMILKK